MEVLVWIHFWKYKQSERVFKALTKATGPDGELLGVEEAWEKMPKSAEAVGWVEQ